MSQQKFNLFEKVYFVNVSSYQEKEIICPDCGGTKFMTVVLYNGEQFTINCEGCKRGWESPSGKIKINEIGYEIVYGTIQGINNTNHGFEYIVEYFYAFVDNENQCHSGNANKHLKENEIFENSEEAEIVAKQEVIKLQKEQDNKVYKKVKDKTWSWHISYYRRQIKDAKRQLEYAENALHVAKLKAKDDTKEIS